MADPYKSIQKSMRRGEVAKLQYLLLNKFHEISIFMKGVSEVNI